MKTKILSAFERIADVWLKIRIPCHFIPLVTSLAWIIFYTLEPSNLVVNYILFPLMIIGWGAALIARLFDFIALVFGLIGTGLSFGFSIFIIPFNFLFALIGGTIALAIAFGLVVYAPGAVTIFCLVRDYFEDAKQR